MIFKKFPNERQLDISDCGPACLKMIARYYGKFYSLQYLRDKCGITRSGVSFLDLSHASEEIGLRTLPLECSIEDLIFKVPLPAIVFWNDSHFVIVYNIKCRNRIFQKKKKIKDSIIYVSDPALGYISYTAEEFIEKTFKHSSAKIKADNIAVMVLEPQPQFYSKEGDEKLQRRQTLQNFLGYFKSYKQSIINLFIVMLIATILQGLLPFISKSVIDIGIQTQDIDFINLVLLANVVIVVSVMLSNVVRDWILLHITSRINISLISDYLIKLLRLSITFFENKSTGDILQRAQDHERIRNFIMNNSLNMFFSALTFFVFAIIMFVYNPVIFYIFLGGSIIYVSWVMSFINIRKRLDWEYFDLTSKNQSYWVETIANVQDIKISNYEKQRRWKWENIQARLYKVNIRVLSITNTQNIGAQFIDSIKNLFITFYCAKAVIAGEISFGVMISTQFIIGMLNAPISQFIQFVISFQSAKISFLRLNEIHQLEDEHEKVGNNNINFPSSKNLSLNNVSFQYTPHGKVILKNIRLNIPEGKVTAIVGDSGSGKSTLLKLLLRLYSPSYGNILIGSMDINNISLREWRERCGAVMQEGKIFNDTILNNIIMGDENIDFDRLKKALKAANISNEIEQLPLGYETKMGEQGRGLSGGQKQRVLIARALYKNPDYLFFDEATNSLDAINEQKIVSALDSVFKNKTVIVVAHRLSTIRKADQIVVMNDGMIVEIGKHESLLEQKGRYYSLVQSQVELSTLFDQ